MPQLDLDPTSLAEVVCATSDLPNLGKLSLSRCAEQRTHNTSFFLLLYHFVLYFRLYTDLWSDTV